MLHIHDETDFIAQVQDERLIVALFWAKWCPPCRKIVPEVHEMARRHSKVAKFLSVEVNLNAQIADKYHIKTMPTFMYLRNGVIMGSTRGAKLSHVDSIITKNT